MGEGTRTERENAMSAAQKRGDTSMAINVHAAEAGAQGACRRPSLTILDHV